MTFTSPTPDQVITSLGTSGQINFSIVTSENIDQTHFTASSIQVTDAGPDGVLGTADDVNVPIDAQLDHGHASRQGHRRPGPRE